jgi:glycosyltransferase involved in cell wall biosynthesis
MRIAFDATALPPMLGGAGNYIVHLLNALRALPTGDELIVLTKARDVDRLGPWNGGARPVVAATESRPLRLAWEQALLPGLLRRLDVDVLHSPHYTMPLAARRCARVVTFHDMIFLLAPEFHQRAKVAFFQRMIRAAAARADHIIADSDATRDDTMRLLDVAADRITTVPLAADPRFRPVRDRAVLSDVRRRYALAERFILTVGTLEPRKNVMAVVRVLRGLQDRGIQCELAVAGMKGWRYGPLFEELSRSALVDRVKFLGFVPTEDLPALYSLADVFMYPSLYEGFGIPPLEAMSCGTPVIASNRSSIPEVVGNGGILINPEDVDQMTEAAARLLQDPESARQLSVRALERAAQFSWERTARQTQQVYARARAARAGAA